MAKNSKAIKPGNFFANLPIFNEAKAEGIEGLTNEERVLGQGAKTKFWETLKNYIDEVLKNLDEVNEIAISQGSDYEEIGKNTIVISTAKSLIKRIVDKVEDCQEAIEKNKGESE